MSSEFPTIHVTADKHRFQLDDLPNAADGKPHNISMNGIFKLKVIDKDVGNMKDSVAHSEAKEKNALNVRKYTRIKFNTGSLAKHLGVSRIAVILHYLFGWFPGVDTLEKYVTAKIKEITATNKENAERIKSEPEKSGAFKATPQAAPAQQPAPPQPAPTAHTAEAATFSRPVPKPKPTPAPNQAPALVEINRKDEQGMDDKANVEADELIRLINEGQLKQASDRLFTKQPRPFKNAQLARALFNRIPPQHVSSFINIILKKYAENLEDMTKPGSNPQLFELLREFQNRNFHKDNPHFLEKADELLKVNDEAPMLGFFDPKLQMKNISVSIVMLACESYNDNAFITPELRNFYKALLASTNNNPITKKNISFFILNRLGDIIKRIVPDNEIPKSLLSLQAPYNAKPPGENPALTHLFNTILQ